MVQNVSQENRSIACRLKNCLFFSPIRFSGRQWMWIRSSKQYLIVKVIAVAFVVLETSLFGALAFVGALVFSKNSKFQDVTIFQPGGERAFLRKVSTENDVATEIKKNLHSSGCDCDVVVSAKPATLYGSDYVSREVHLQLSRTSCIRRIFATLKQQFFNKDFFDLKQIYPCISGKGSVEGIDGLRSVLSVCQEIHIYMPFDLTYVRLRTGKVKDLCNATI